MSQLSVTDAFDPNSVLGQRVLSGLGDVEELLETTSHFPTEQITTPAQHLLNAGGKRIRPVLTLVAAHCAAESMSDAVYAQVVKAAAVVELTHLATLYHDDVMDSAPTRRGAPSAHEVWGNTVAILTGDMLFARASGLVAQLGTEAVQLQAETFERLCTGQLQETLGPQPDQDPIAFHLQVLSGKTGSLIATSARFGAMFSGASAEVAEALSVYGEKVGVAFQVADDLLDLTSDGTVSGKTPGTDLREGVPTLPVLYAQKAAADGHSAAIAALELLAADLQSDEALSKAVAAIVELPAMAQARAHAHELAHAALAALAPVPEGEAKDVLVRLAASLVDRDA